MKKTPLTDDEMAGIVLDYTQNGFSQHTLARAYAVCEKRVRGILTEAGVDIQSIANRRRSETQKNTNHRK